MNRQELEALSEQQLRQLIADAESVLSARCPASSAPATGIFGGGATAAGGSGSGTAGLFSPPDRAVSTGSGLFSFGNSPAAPSSGGLFGGTGGDLFSGPASGFFAGTGGGLFGGSSSGGTGGDLFGGTGGGLFSGSSSGLFSASGGGSAAPPTSGKLFGGSGGGLFGGACASPPFTLAAQATGAAVADAVRGVGDVADEGDHDENVEAECLEIPGWTPSMTLQVLDHVPTGEEGEEQLYSQRSKLYRFKDEEWKERGLGDAKLLQNKANGRVRFLLRQEKSGKVVSNHFILDHAVYCDLRSNAGSNKCWCWVAQDWADNEKQTEKFALKFGTEELAAAFQEAFADAKARNKAAFEKETAA